MILKQIVHFDFDSAYLEKGEKEKLVELIKVLQRNKKIKIYIDGHTDSTGSEQYNQVLSEKRANSVSDYFNSRDVTSARLAAYGYGENHPVADNDSETGRSQNRRVEIALVPITTG